ncbi:MAG: hypothetical protein RL298_2019 [Pseudomonadota bacterium]
MVMLNSLALTDALLCLIAAWLASKNTLAVGYRMALTMLAIPALLGFLRFSGIYPLETWHPLFTLLSASAALPLLAICVLAPQSIVATRKQFAIIFLGVGKLRIYDQALGLLSMLVILVAMIKRNENTRALGAALMLAGSVLFVLKVSVPPWLMPGDWLHLGMAFGLILVTSEVLVIRDLPSAQEIT